MSESAPEPIVEGPGTGTGGPSAAGAVVPVPDPVDAGQAQGNRVVVITPQGMAVASDDSLTDLIEQPAKVMRIGSMIKQLLEEVRSSPLDEAGRVRLAAVHERSIAELESGLAPELVAELRRISLPLSGDATPSDAELRVAQAQLVGWLEGLFHGIQTALFAQQVASKAQFEEMRRRALPGGPVVGMPEGTAPGLPAPGGGTGQYL